jgi:KaiC/GvpD/RAD55 family RecA-like ATPase
VNILNLFDSIIFMKQIIHSNNQLHKVLTILKMRGSNHNKESREYDITNDGIMISHEPFIFGH